MYRMVPYNYDSAPIGVPVGMQLVEVEPTDRLWRCNVMSIENRFVSQDVFCNPTEHGTGEGCTDECGMVIVVRVPKEGTGYPQGAVTRAAELQAEDADPELHHHEVSHSHPFKNLDHTHDQPRLDDDEKEGDDDV